MGHVEVEAEGLVCIWYVGAAVHTPLIQPHIRSFQRHGDGYGDVLDGWKRLTVSNLGDNCRTESLVKECTAGWLASVLRLKSSGFVPLVSGPLFL